MGSAAFIQEMEEVERISVPQSEDVPVELLHRIQSLLSVQKAACTCVLSKSWLHAWSTIPTLRFYVKRYFSNEEEKYIKLIDSTLERYHRENIPITSFDLHFGIKNQKSVYLANKWVRTVTSRSCLKELYLTISVNKSLTLPDELFSGENLDTISVKANDVIVNYSLLISNNLVIKCVNLRVLELFAVTISDEAFLNLLSTCILLENINLSFCDGLKKINVKNLRYLNELKIIPSERDYSLEIYDVPSLHLFYYSFLLCLWDRRKPLFSTTVALGSVRELVLDSVIMNDAYSYIISKFPSLESLTLEIHGSDANIVDIKCVSLKRLNIHLFSDVQINVQVEAPKLKKFLYKGALMPGLLFLSIAPNEIVLTLELMNPVDQTFFLKMREALNLSSKFNIKIISYSSNFIVPLINIDDVRRMVPFPATNVQKLTFDEYSDKGLWEHPRLLFDAFFSICHPNYVKIYPFDSSSHTLIARSMIGKARKEYWQDLEDVEIENPLRGKWETLTSSWISSRDGLFILHFKLTWCSLYKLIWFFVPFSY